MKRGFYTIMSAQFFSSLADQALFVVAIALLESTHAADWQKAALVPIFAIFYVALAPVVGAFADSLPKARVMFISNTIKVIGCLMMLFGSHPLFAYAFVGLGAAAYSPAKYGILTELLPPSQLVKANGWIEGLTIASIILGILFGGQLIGGRIMGHSIPDLLLSIEMPFFDTHITHPAQAAICVLIFVYVLAAGFNTRIPLTGVKMRPIPRNPLALLPDFWRCNNLLWKDKLGQISLATTTLFWGASGNLKYIVLAWGALALGYNTTDASALVGVVAIGTAVGAVLASLYTRLDSATKVIPLGILMGLFVVFMIFINSVYLAIPFLILVGGLGGFLVVPMNALLQHRGHNLMGAGRSIAVQNFNEQICILLLGGLYTLSAGLGLSTYGAIAAFGFLVAGVMVAIYIWHARNCVRHPEQIAYLLSIARDDENH